MSVILSIAKTTLGEAIRRKVLLVILLIGVLFLGCISNGMTLINVSEYWQYVVRGGIILGAVLLNQVLERVR